MKGRKVNLDYLNLYQEIPLFCALAIGNFFRIKTLRTTGRVLIVNTCLIGEFAASLPAIRDYIQRNENVVVDLMVSPPLKPLAERVRGVGNVYVVRSLYGRPNERVGNARHEFAAYDEVLVMRISKDAFRMIRTIPTARIRTDLREYIGYALHLWGRMISRKPPKQWRELNFEMLNGQARTIPFDDIFALTESDYAFVADLEAFRTTRKKIIIHTGAGWVMKKWSNDKWVTLLHRIHDLGDVRFIFVGEGGDTRDYEAIAGKLGFQTYSLISKINLLQLLFALRRGDYFIGTDSGPRNLAHLAGVRSVCIFGPGPHFYMPPDPRDIVIDKSRGRGLYQMFFYKKHGFINDITADEVYEGFKKLWKS